jgi:hypothetical protein
MKQEWARVTINIKPLEYRWFRIYCAEQGKSVSEMVRYIIEQKMQEKAKAAKSS